MQLTIFVRGNKIFYRFSYSLTGKNANDMLLSITDRRKFAKVLRIIT